MKNLIAELYKSPKTVFTNKDLSLLWRENNPDNLKMKISYYVKQGALNKLTRGIFAKDANYNPKELATSLYTPSYISFETVLRQAGIIFQHYETLFVASRYSKAVKCDNYSFTFRKLKDEILYNPAGITNLDNFSVAGKERAFLDMLYLFPDYYFDNLKPLDWQSCFELVKIYNNQQLVKRLSQYHQSYAQ